MWTSSWSTHNVDHHHSLQNYGNLPIFFQSFDNSLPAIYESFIGHLLEKTRITIERGERVLILALTKKSSEEIANYMIAQWFKTYYLHSEIDTIDRREIINKLKSWEIDVLVWVNLLREGIDMPEVWFIAILDADKEGFLRSTTALIQNIWRAARNPNSEVALYADRITHSMIKALRETYRRRSHQQDHNMTHNITPTMAISNVKSLNVVRTDEELEHHKNYQLIRSWKVKKLKRLTKKEKDIILTDLKKQLDSAISEWRFEDAALLRDQIKDIDET
jgi:excinuclease ABC subunit B